MKMFLLITLAITARIASADTQCQRVCDSAGNERGHRCYYVCPTNSQNVQFECNASENGRSIDVTGVAELGRYYRMGHSEIASGQVDFSDDTININMPIKAGDYQDSSGVWFNAFNPQNGSQAKFEINFGSPSFLMPDGEAGERIRATCSLTPQ
jgi:hypothetical protein